MLVWLAAGVLAYVVIAIADLIAGQLAPDNRAAAGHLALGATLVMAGLYQFTALKRACLRHCRSPLAFVALHWREGPLGALRMGVQHGVFCLGCCWALFAVLVAVGIMSLAWMLLISLAVFVEKVLPFGRRASAAIGIALLMLGVLIVGRSLPMLWTA